MPGTAGVQKEISYITKDRVLISYELPLNEIVMDFYDRLKSSPRGTLRWITSSPDMWSRTS